VQLINYSAFWGQSFVAELTRISAHGEKKLKLRRASLAKPPRQDSIPEKPETKGNGKLELDEYVDANSPDRIRVQQTNGHANGTNGA
jgi:hypothetical protein